MEIDEYKEALELWNWFKEESLKDFQKTYDLLGINKFDSYTGESYYKNLANDVVEEIEKKDSPNKEYITIKLN